MKTMRETQRNKINNKKLGQTNSLRNEEQKDSKNDCKKILRKRYKK